MNFKVFYTLFFTLAAFVLIGQEETGVVAIPDSTEKEVFVFNLVEEMPLIEGCEDNKQNEVNRKCFNEMILKHVVNNFKYPNAARKHGVQGKMYVNFVVERDGSISNVNLLRSIESVHKDNDKLVKYARLLDEEAIRVISEVKINKPARQRGKPVRISYTMPINATLQ